MESRTQRPRIADVAREAGVSKTAVSFAFNAPDRLSVETTERIRSVALRLGYTPHPVARMLTQRRTGTIGVLTPQALSVVFRNPFFGAFSAGVARVAEEHGYALHFISPFRGSLVGAMTRATVDGVVAVGLGADHPEIEDIRRAGLPLVLVDSQALPDHADGSPAVSPHGCADPSAPDLTVERCVDLSEPTAGLGTSGWLSLGPASELLGIDPDTLRRWADEGRVPACPYKRAETRGDLPCSCAHLAGTGTRP